MYNPKEIEPKWQKFWEDNRSHEFNPESKKKKYYCLVMFPYPSGRIHMGHVRNYVIGDVFARFYRLNNREVFHPIGWDSFGLPAENAAIKNNIHPGHWTGENIAHMKKQLKLLGISYDWSTEIATSTPEYYRWNQWFFLKMLEKNLVYKKKSEVNWCSECSTVLANEQVAAGVCWRCNTVIEKKELEQWFIKITDFAGDLLAGHVELTNNWPDEVLAMQKYWLGKSAGVEIDFQIEDSDETIKIFTTRPDTLFGATFVVLAPEHPLIKENGGQRTADRGYIETTKKKTAQEKFSLEKTGVFTGLYAINPVNNEKLPVWISDYVTMDYGTGAIMCVPAHDHRDFEFAKKYNLPIRVVIQPLSPIPYPLSPNSAYEGEGIMLNSGKYSDLDNKTGAEKITDELIKKGIATRKTNWRMKDWLISRQRYWGTPIPVIYCEKCDVQPVNYDDLPVLLPDDATITGSGDSPLATYRKFVETLCPKCGGEARRETDTMDTFVDSSWYYARYCDPDNTEFPFDPEKTDKLLPVDQYIGGIEHACMHLIYARFWQRFMREQGLVKDAEPFKKLLTQGMVTLKGETMSKSKGNIIEPDELIKKYGADTLRIFILFAAPPEKQLDWSESGVEGAWRFLNRIWRIVERYCAAKSGATAENQSQDAQKLLKITAKTIKKVSDDIEAEKQFNTAIASIMEFLNELYSYDKIGDNASHKAIESLLILLYPFAPHISAELYQKFYDSSTMMIKSWPEINTDLLKDESREIAVQINGKLRGVITVNSNTSKDAVMDIIKQDNNLLKYLRDKQIKKFIYVEGKLASIVTE